MDITEKVLSQASKSRTFETHRRIIPCEIPSSESSFISETANLLFVLNDSSKVLKEIISDASARVQFDSHSDRSQRLSDRLENQIKVAQIKLDEIKNLDIRTCCSYAIHDVLQKKLFLITKDFQKTLQARTKQLKRTSQKAKKSHLEVESKEKPTFLDTDELVQNVEDLSELQSRAQSVEQVETQMAEVAGLMQKIALIVHEQQVTVERIDMNTEMSLNNLENAKKEIDKYYSSVTSNRNLGIKVFMIFVIFFVFYVVFLV